MENIKLSKSNLARLSKSVKVPVYAQNQLVPSIIHIGLGHFHRAHQAAYLDRLLSAGLSNDGIFEINLVPDTLPIASILEKQDYLYTLVTKSPAAKPDVRVIGAITGYMNAAGDKRQAIGKTAAESTGLITLTVTEGGYYFNKETGEPNLNEEPVKWDFENRDNPKTASGFLAAVLAKRYRESKKPLTIMSCDNIPSNGKILQNCVMFFCRRHYPEIVNWITDTVSFPSSMIDRITPGTTVALIRELEDSYGITDGWPVCGEDYIQWVLEENFRTKIPDYAAAGVQIVKNVEPYELMKMRLLNGSHVALAFPAYLLGRRFVDEAITDPLLNAYIRNHYMEEAGATLEPVPGIDIEAYKNTLISRFSNKNISDTIARLCSQGSSKMPGYVLNPLAGAVRQNLPHSTICFALACWARYLDGKDEQGNEIPVEDVNKERMQAAAAKAQTDPASFLTAAGLQGLTPEQLNRTAAIFQTYLKTIYRKGVKAVLEELTAKN
ncbi:MAG: mannitol dehydrogenase family protein [Treponema sp.]|nr:mannitol dehydrogenase family protein [Treponema sp.]